MPITGLFQSEFKTKLPCFSECRQGTQGQEHVGGAGHVVGWSKVDSFVEVRESRAKTLGRPELKGGNSAVTGAAIGPAAEDTTTTTNSRVATSWQVGFW